MKPFICTTCGTQFPDSGESPAGCPICEDDRQYVRAEGQTWTTMEELRQSGHRNEFRSLEPGMTGICTTPGFAIGQRAILVQTEEGNILWDCLSYLDQETAGKVERLGGIAAIAISHPHFYSSMIDWSSRFDSSPIFLHEANRPFVMRPGPAIRFWNEETVSPLPGVTLIRCGGHFPGSTVLHWGQGSEGGGVLLTGDTLSVAADRRYVSFMYSYPNRIPLAPYEVRRVVNSLRPFRFRRLYGGWWDAVVVEKAEQSVVVSADRYISHLEG